MIRILIVSDIRIYREGLAESLQNRDGVTVVGTATCSDEAVCLAGELSPTVVLIDHALPESLRTMRMVSELHPDIKVVALGLLESEDGVLACAEAGVAGYVPRDATLECLVATVQSTTRGEFRCSPRIAASLLRQVARTAAAGNQLPAHPTLTSREVEIVRLIEQELSNKEIATRLGIEVATVKNHVHNLLEKLQVHRRGQAAARFRARRRMSPLGSNSMAPPGALRASGWEVGTAL
jgi:DNA-binding NarL/FixJ family response regulator